MDSPFNTRKKFLQTLIPSLPKKPSKHVGRGWAPVNIALIKYWGKRDPILNLPITDSLSIALSVGTITTLSEAPFYDTIHLNGTPLAPSSPFFHRAQSYLNLFRPHDNFYFSLDTRNDIPTAAGLASSASGFAALAVAIDDFFDLTLSKKQLSIIARLGSGSASRSIYPGYVLWKKGILDTGEDCFSIPLQNTPTDLCLGIIITNSSEKPIGSSEAMQRTVTTSSLYRYWPDIIEKDISVALEAISDRNFSLLGQTAEQNALFMHNTMMTASPPICYWNEQTLSTLKTIFDARSNGLPIYATLDAGPNVKLLFHPDDRKKVLQLFPNLWEIPLY